jgi:mono/diheme cytochrome c family protein
VDRTCLEPFRRVGPRPPDVVWLVLIACFAGGCHRDMADQPKLEPYEVSRFFQDGAVNRPVVAGTIARGQLKTDQHFFTGKVAGKPATTFPQPLTAELLARGAQRYRIYCSQCHDGTGYGQGMVVRRGFTQPPSFHIERLRNAPVGYYFDVITNGFGRMPAHADLVRPADRWAVIAYVRALQLSQHVERNQLTSEDLDALTASNMPPSNATAPASEKAHE